MVTEANASHECARSKSTAPGSPEYLSHFLFTGKRWTMCGFVFGEPDNTIIERFLQRFM